MQAQIQQLDSTLAACAAAWGTREAVNAFQEYRERLVALLDPAGPAPTEVGTGEWDGTCQFVVKSK